MDASSAVDMTARDRTLVGPLLRSPADTGAGRVRRNARGIRARDRRRRAIGVGGDAGGGNARRGNAGGGRRSGIGRTAISKADDLGTSDNESIKRIGPDVGPVESIVHSGEGGEIAGRWLVSASVLHVHLTTEGSEPLEYNLKPDEIRTRSRGSIVVVQQSEARRSHSGPTAARKKCQLCQVEAGMQRD